MARQSRRRLIQGSVALVSLGLLAGCGIPLGPAAQPARLRRIGYLQASTAASQAPNFEAFGQGLRELGYVEGRDVAFEPRYADARPERLPELAAELVRLEVDVILTGGLVAIRAAGHATTTIPIVFAAGPDPVAAGLVASLAHPGGNITGLTLFAGEEHAKRLELLKEAVPELALVAVLWGRNNPGNFRETEPAAQRLGVQVLSLELRSPDELDTVLEGATTGQADGLMVAGGAALGFATPRIVEFAARHGLPAMYSNSPAIDAGGLMMYGTNIPQNYRRAATYVDKILKGTKPADLPVQLPTTFDFVVNLKTAQALGLTIPQSILQQATQVIQ
jgi:putative ABC transport system substrate-binding protein